MAAATKITSRYAGLGRINRPSEVYRAPKALSHYRFANVIEVDDAKQLFETPLDRYSIAEAREFSMFLSWAESGISPESLKGTALAEDEQAYRDFLCDFPLESAHTRLEAARAEAICKGRKKADYISTTIRNRSGATLTLKFLVIDLDPERAHEKFKTEGGALDWQKVGDFCDANEPRIVDRLSRVLTSPGGKGLHLVFDISPFQLGLKSMARTEFLARTVMRRLTAIFDWHGMGGDPSAKGLERWAANWEDETKLLDQDIWRNTRKRSESRRDRVLSDLYEYTNRHAALRPSRAFLYDHGRILYPDSRTEKKLARVYDHLLQNDCGTSIAFGDLQSLGGFAENTLRRLLKDPPCWLGVSRHGKQYDLRIEASVQLTRRSRWLMNEGDFQFELHEPEYVMDGERFNWIGSLAAHCKQHGVSQERLERCLVKIVPRVPGWETSRNLTSNLPALIRAIYRNQEDTENARIHQQMVGWVEKVLDEIDEAPLTIRPYWHLKSLCKKGGAIPKGNKPLFPSLPHEHNHDAGLIPESTLFPATPASPFPEGVRPGSLRAGQALSSVVDTASPGIQNPGCESVSSSAAGDTGLCEFDPARRADFLSRALEPGNVARAISDVVAGNSKAAGLDRIAPAQLPGVWRNFGPSIASQLAQGCYEPKPARMQDGFKSSGGSRTIAILSVVDRMLLKALDWVLKPCIEPRFSRWSFGWRSGVGPRHAVASANRHIADGYVWVGATDVKNCFAGIDHAMLLDVLQSATGDELLVAQVLRFLQSGAPAGVGILQGSPLSPLLANLFLDQLDRHLESKGIRFCRYGDDIRVFARTWADAEAALQVVGEELRCLRLQMNQDKTMVGHASVARFCQKPLAAPRPGPEDDPAPPLSFAFAHDKSRQSQNQQAAAPITAETSLPKQNSVTSAPFDHLSGSALSSAFSKALMISRLPVAEKARILTEVTSIADIDEKERARREWLTRLAAAPSTE